MATPQPQLFGATMDPEQMAEAKALQFSQMSPQQQMQYNIYRNVNRLGRGVAGLFGADVTDPIARKSSELRRIADQFDTTTAEGMMQYAQALRSIDPNLAVQAAEKAQAMREKESKIKYEEARGKALTSGIGRLNPQNYTAESWAKYSESGDLKDLVDKPGKGTTTKGPIGNISPKDFTPESMQAFLTTVQEGSPDYSLLVRIKPEDKGLPASLVKEAATLDTKIVSLENSIATISNTSSKIDKLDLGLFQNFARGGQAWLGINAKDRIEFDATRRTALQEANNLLLLAKGTQTEGDAQRARDQIANENTWKNKEALKAAFEDLRKTHQNTLDALKAGRSTIVSQAKAQPTSSKTAAPAPAASAPANADEAKIAKFMAANPKLSREQVIANMKRMGFLPSNK